MRAESSEKRGRRKEKNVNFRICKFENQFWKNHHSTSKGLYIMSETASNARPQAKGETLGADSKQGDVRMSNIIAAKGS